MGDDASATRVIGIGQAYAGDDGVGREVAEQLRAAGVAADVVDDGAGLVNLLIDASPKIIIVDAVVGGGAPGTVHVLRYEELERGPRPVSSHGITVAHAIALARRFNPGLDVRIVGVAVERPQVLRRGLSREVAAAVPEAVKRIETLLIED